MADFVSNFLDGLRERRQREDQQAAKAEQIRQFQQQQAQHMFEFNANKALANKQFDFNRQEAERQQKRQEFQDTLALQDLKATGVAEDAVEGMSGFAGGDVVEAPTGQRIRILTPQERQERQLQLQIGNLKSSFAQKSKLIREIGGAEAGQAFDDLLKNPEFLAEAIGGVKNFTGQRPQNIPQNFQAAIIRDTEAKVASGDFTRADATKMYQKLLTQQQASSVPRIVGPEGAVTNTPTFEQQVDRVVEQTAGSIRPQVQTLTGLTIEQIVANPEIALQKLTEAVKAQEQSLSPSARPFIPIIVERIIKNIINDNKKPKTGGFLQGMKDALGNQTGGPGSNLTQEQRKSLGYE